MVFGLQPLPLSATRAQRNCDGGYAFRDGCATEGYALRDRAARLRDGCATERPTRDTHARRVGHALRYGWGPPEIRMRYGITTLPGVSERLRRVRYEPGKGPIT